MITETLSKYDSETKIAAIGKKVDELSIEIENLRSIKNPYQIELNLLESKRLELQSYIVHFLYLIGELK